MVTEYQDQSEMWSGADVCSGVVLYDGTPARDLAIPVCRHLAQTFAGDLEFAFTWWRIKYLDDAEVAGEAAQAAVKADLIVVALQSAESLPSEIERWFECWINQRVGAGGVIVLLEQPRAGNDWLPPDDAYLRQLARRANLDYLPLSRPVTAPAPVDRLREDEALPNIIGLDQVPDRQYHSSGWGINE